MPDLTYPAVVLSALAAMALIAGCGSDQKTEPAPARAPESASPLDGTFTVERGAKKTSGGIEIPDSNDTLTWVARTACRASGCVATAALIDPGDPTAPHASLVFDYVDGHWSSVHEVAATCAMQSGDVPVQDWQTYTLTPQPDGTLTGTFTDRAALAGSCVNLSRPVTVRRTGDVDPEIDVEDPDSFGPRVESQAVWLHGSYSYTETDPTSGRELLVHTYRGDTTCLRTGDRCLTFMVNPESFGLLVLAFADGTWRQTTAPMSVECAAGTGASVKTGEYAFPRDAKNPIAALAGHEHQDQTGGCPGSFDFDANLERIGD